MRNLSQPGPIAPGIGDFVQSLLGGGARRQAAERSALANADNLVKAQIQADELTQRQGLGDVLAGAGIPQSDVLAAVMRAGFGNFQQSTAGQQNLGDLALQTEVAGQARDPNPDVALINRLLAARSGAGGPLSPQEASVVPLGEAAVQKAQAETALAQARTTAANAQAGASGAREALYARTDPNRSRTQARTVGDVSSLDLGDIAAIERSEGRPLTAEEKQTYLSTGKLQTQAPKQRFTQEQVLTQLQRAREAVRLGKLSKAQAQKRLRDAGLVNAAEAL